MSYPDFSISVAITLLLRLYYYTLSEMNAVELLPPDFNAAEKYPVLFHVYGGPGSQLVSYQFDLSWHTFIASKLRYIVVTVCIICFFDTFFLSVENSTEISLK